MSWLMQEQPTPQPDGVATTFSLTGAYVLGSLRVYLQGQKVLSACVVEDDNLSGIFSLDLDEPASDGWTLEVVYIDPSAPVGVFADQLRVELAGAPLEATIDQATVRADINTGIDLAVMLSSKTIRADIDAQTLDVEIGC